MTRSIKGDETVANTVADKLAEACKLIEAGWCRGAWGRNAKGDVTLYSDVGTVSVCARGALWAGNYLVDAEVAFEQAIGTSDIAAWNDAPERTQAEVIAAFKRAEQIARGEAA